jgi:putative CocE/NonD family hydrolase
VTEPQIIVELDQEIRTRDGTILRADVYRPAEVGEYPTLLGRTCYDKGTWGRWIEPERSASEGWVVVFNDIRGHFGSEGVYDPFRTDMEDGYDVVEWCAAQPWSNGRVGMFGSSACGFVQLQAAVTQPPHLAAIAPMQTWSSMGRGCTYDPGGAYSMYTQEWSMMQVGAVREVVHGLRHDAQEIRNAAGRGRWEIGRWHGHLPVGELPPLSRDAAPWYYAWLEHPDHDEWWSDRDVASRFDRLSLPGLHLVGWFDRFCRSTVANYLAMRRGGDGPPQRLVIGPWPHGVPVITASGDQFFGVPAEVDARSLVLGWYEHWLRSAAGSAPAEPEVRYFLLGANEWHDAPSWPLPNARNTTFHLRSGGGANTDSGDGRLDQEPPRPASLPTATSMTPPTRPRACRGGWPARGARWIRLRSKSGAMSCATPLPRWRRRWTWWGRSLRGCGPSPIARTPTGSPSSWTSIPTAMSTASPRA